MLCVFFPEEGEEVVLTHCLVLLLYCRLLVVSGAVWAVEASVVDSAPPLWVQALASLQDWVGGRLGVVN